MIRPSRLSLARHCTWSSKLAEDHDQSSVHAERGTAFHEVMADVFMGRVEHPQYTPAIACLPPGKRESEVRVQMHDPETGDLITEGTADAVITLDDGGILVADWKSGQPTYVPEPDENWQLLAYGAGLALTREAPYFKTALWFKDYGWRWGKCKFTDGEDLWAIIREIKAVSKRAETPRAVTGPHCDGCFQRKNCEAWLLPVAIGSSALEPFTRPGGLTRENAGEALRVYGAMKDAVSIAEAQLKGFARENDGIVVDGKVWSPGASAGRRSLSLAAVELYPDLMRELESRGCISEGKPYEVFKWRNAGNRNTGRSNGATSAWLEKEVVKDVKPKRARKTNP